MHYISYVPELDLKPVQFVFYHQVSIIIIHILTLKQQTVYVTYLQTDVCTVKRRYTIVYVSIAYCNYIYTCLYKYR